MDPCGCTCTPAASRFPRTRGDGPRPAGLLVGRYGVSPHTRGWTQPPVDVVAPVAGFPAHAGMDRVGFERGFAGLRFPRTRGDGPTPPSPSHSSDAVSPHTRGWTRRSRRGGRANRGFPAHAGMDRSDTADHACQRWFPRTRGDGPMGRLITTARMRVSPHTRGWTVPEVVHRHGRRGFPAHAGMDLQRSRLPQATCGFPRTRGDGPVATFRGMPLPGVSPHTRGWTHRVRRGARPVLGFPAHAGMDPAACPRCRPSSRFPRTRGDGPPSRRTSVPPRRVSPHTRGWTSRKLSDGSRRRGFPAHAGMDRSTARASTGASWFPRTRGDGPAIALPTWQRDGVSPHTRGWTHQQRHDGLPARGFPAHAGMDPGRSLASSRIPRFPRTRGDGPQRQSVPAGAKTVSPHTRGWTSWAGQPWQGASGFPAHAGMDPGEPARSPPSSRFPRTRGDGPSCLPARSASSAVSPHTRGWTRERDLLIGEHRGFPAHAGMDPWRSFGGPAGFGFPRTRGDGPERHAGCFSSHPVSPHTRDGPVKPAGTGEGAAVSPHTRGWTRLAAPCAVRRHGFPAHAGMDPGRPRLGDGPRGFPRTRGDGPGTHG